MERKHGNYKETWKLFQYTRLYIRSYSDDESPYKSPVLNARFSISVLCSGAPSGLGVQGLGV